ncbi:hypothetical protein EYR40_009130 [Pleurotus pulmonarius]|nr:hypothetical protein EYR40_009130 [Pleurotus pulmonarius]
MRATPEGDDSDFTDDGYGYEDDPEKAYYVDESRLEESGKGNHKCESEDECSSDSEYDNSESEEDGEDASEGDTSTTDSSDDSDNSDNAANERESNLEVAQSAMSSELSSAHPIGTSIEKTNDDTERTAKPAPPEPPVTPTKSARAPLRAVSQLSPQRRQTPMLSPPASSIKTNAKSSFSGIYKASAAGFSKEM